MLRACRKASKPATEQDIHGQSGWGPRALRDVLAMGGSGKLGRSSGPVRVVVFVGVAAVMTRAMAVACAHHEHHHHWAGEQDQRQQNRRGGGTEGECNEDSGDQCRAIPHHVLTLHR